MTIPYRGKQFLFKQPDGTQLYVQGWGDQYHALFRTLDGHLVVRNPVTGFYDFASIAQGHQLQPTGLRAGIDAIQPSPLSGKMFSAAETKSLILSNPGLPQTLSRWRVRSERKRRISHASMPGNLALAPPSRKTVGTFVGLCILIEFPDVPGTISPSQVEAFLNARPYTGFGNNGSVREYFRDISGGRLDYSSIVTPYITAQQPRDYYTDPAVQQPIRAYELIGEALSSLQAGGFDFSRLTADDEGYIYAINVYYAGPCVNNWAEGLWPHSYHLANPVQVLPGRKVFDYQFTDMGIELTLGTFCHENGHMVCDFPDLYDYGNESAGAGVYCLMCGGADVDEKNPTHVGAYLKYRAGWADAVDHITHGSQYGFQGGNHFMLFSKDEQEYFILEQRRRAERDAGLPASGLAIWHIDEQGSNNYEQGTAAKHYECALVQADGQYHLEHASNDGDVFDLYPNGGKTEFSDSTTPSSRWWNGVASGLTVQNISDGGNTVTFTT